MIDKTEFWMGVIVLTIAIGALFVVEYTYDRLGEQKIIETCKEAK